ncbi:ABC transporter substrate-binding protein [Occultella aeris]|uniref:Oligopeptide-binding protein OppA n=1 Tax=Occultella aeris TaxID=2761496 RepID=A0A7M4DFJ3_9MICO|nr:peptide ABC transporter substrate-binding protein [Occultella aeris]VZO35686.1 Oligopeptide-binding protein OppA precursor [Occultella aeris]
MPHSARPVNSSSPALLLGRRSFLAATMATATGVLAGCGFSDDGGNDATTAPDQDADPQRTGTLRQSMLPVAALDPAVNGNSSFGQIMMIGLWEGLVAIDADQPDQVVPGAAESWTVSEDGLVYTFTIRADAVWSNGDPVTANDFEWNWKRILTPGIAGEGSPSYVHTVVGVQGADAYMAGVTEDFATVGAKAVDDSTFELTLVHSNADLLVHLAGFWALPLHPATVEELGDAWLVPEGWVSNGPFLLDSFRVNQGAVLVPNDTYWDKDSYFLERWEVTFNDGGTTADLLAFQQGEIDITGRIEDNLEAVTASDVADQLVSSPTNQVRRLVVMNSEHPALHDVRVRQALALAIDRDALAGIAEPAVAGTSLLPSAVPGGDEVPGISFDVDQAKELLSEAGYPDGVGMPTIQLLDFQASPWVEAIGQMWRDNIGVTATLDVVEVGVYSSKRALVHPADYTGFYVQNGAINPPTMLAAVQGIFPTAPQIYGANLIPAAEAAQVLASIESEAPLAEQMAIIDGSRPAELQQTSELVAAALTETDVDKQRDMLTEAATAWVDAFAMIPVLWGGYNLLVKPHVENLRPWYYGTVFTTKGVTITS